MRREALYSVHFPVVISMMHCVHHKFLLFVIPVQTVLQDPKISTFQCYNQRSFTLSHLEYALTAIFETVKGHEGQP